MTARTVTLPAPTRRWVPRAAAPVDEAAVEHLTRALRLPEPLCRLLVVRGLASESAARQYLKPRLDQLGDPFGLAGMDEAATRLDRAIDAGETILVHGDYDVDGICSTALLTRVLRAIGGRPVPFVPNRMTDGYDLGTAGIRAAADADASLILTADCGIVAHDAVDAANRAGIDVIVTDHHTPGETLPPAIAVVNPNRPDCGYPETGLAGVGVAFKLCQALVRTRGLDPEPLLHHLDLVAVATIADVAPLTGENRVMARYGLRVLKQTRNAGLRALLETTDLMRHERLEAGHVGYVLAPRINAVGRVGEARYGVHLLLSDSLDEARGLAERLERENRTRRKVDRRILAEALERLERDYDPDRDYGVVLAGRDWHPGVIGIVASRIAERIHRPTVLIALDGPDGADGADGADGSDGADDGPARGSARSIPSFHMYDALAACSEHLERFGGHEQAAGFDIRAERVDAFRSAFNETARETLSTDDLVAEVIVDMDLELRWADDRLLGLLRHFGPFGAGNPSPVFAARGATVAGSPRVVGNGHLKMTLAQDATRLPAIGFGMADRIDALGLADGRPIDAAFELQMNRWRGREELQAKLVDLRPPT